MPPLLLLLPLLLQAALGLYYLHIGEAGGGAGQGVKIGEAWDSWSWLQVRLVRLSKPPALSSISQQCFVASLQLYTPVSISTGICRADEKRVTTL
jgi:hypothetical protein